MVGHRKTHTYPQGRPKPLVWVSIAFAALAVTWVFLVPGHRWRAIGVISTFIAVAILDRKLHLHYEQTGQAVRIPRPALTVIKFPGGISATMLIARLAFFATVLVMFVFGLAPMNEMTARRGIIGCVFALIVVAVLNVGLERHYVNTGRATEVDSSRNPEQTGTQS